MPSHLGLVHRVEPDGYERCIALLPDEELKEFLHAHETAHPGVVVWAYDVTVAGVAQALPEGTPVHVVLSGSPGAEVCTSGYLDLAAAEAQASSLRCCRAVRYASEPVPDAFTESNRSGGFTSIDEFYERAVQADPDRLAKSSTPARVLTLPVGWRLAPAQK